MTPVCIGQIPALCFIFSYSSLHSFLRLKETKAGIPHYVLALFYSLPLLSVQPQINKAPTKVPSAVQAAPTRMNGC